MTIASSWPRQRRSLAAWPLAQVCAHRADSRLDEKSGKEGKDEKSGKHHSNHRRSRKHDHSIPFGQVIPLDKGHK